MAKEIKDDINKEDLEMEQNQLEEADNLNDDLMHLEDDDFNSSSELSDSSDKTPDSNENNKEDNNKTDEDSGISKIKDGVNDIRGKGEAAALNLASSIGSSDFEADDNGDPSLSENMLETGIDTANDYIDMKNSIEARKQKKEREKREKEEKEKDNKGKGEEKKPKGGKKGSQRSGSGSHDDQGSSEPGVDLDSVAANGPISRMLKGNNNPNSITKKAAKFKIGLIVAPLVLAVFGFIMFTIALIPNLIGNFFSRDDLESSLSEFGEDGAHGEDADWELNVDDVYADIAGVIQKGINKAYARERKKFDDEVTSQQKKHDNWIDEDDESVEYMDIEGSNLPVYDPDKPKFDPEASVFNVERSNSSFKSYANATTYAQQVGRIIADFSVSIGNSAAQKGNYKKLQKILEKGDVTKDLFETTIEHKTSDHTRRYVELEKKKEKHEGATVESLRMVPVNQGYGDYILVNRDIDGVVGTVYEYVGKNKGNYLSFSKDYKRVAKGKGTHKREYDEEAGYYKYKRAILGGDYEEADTSFTANIYSMEEKEVKVPVVKEAKYKEHYVSGELKHKNPEAVSDYLYSDKDIVAPDQSVLNFHPDAVNNFSTGVWNRKQTADYIRKTDYYDMELNYKYDYDEDAFKVEDLDDDAYDFIGGSKNKETSNNGVFNEILANDEKDDDKPKTDNLGSPINDSDILFGKNKKWFESEEKRTNEEGIECQLFGTNMSSNCGAPIQYKKPGGLFSWFRKPVPQVLYGKSRVQYDATKLEEDDEGDLDQRVEPLTVLERSDEFFEEIMESIEVASTIGANPAGMGNGAGGQIVADLALQQIEIHGSRNPATLGGTPFISEANRLAREQGWDAWSGWANGINWCAAFVGFIMMQAGYATDTDIVRIRDYSVYNVGGWEMGMRELNATFLYSEGHTDFIPQPGDLMLSRWSTAETLGHISIVVDYNPETDVVTTVDGNYLNMLVMPEVARLSKITEATPEVMGFIRPPYPEASAEANVVAQVVMDSSGLAVNYFKGGSSPVIGSAALSGSGIKTYLESVYRVYKDEVEAIGEKYGGGNNKALKLARGESVSDMSMKDGSNEEKMIKEILNTTWGKSIYNMVAVNHIGKLYSDYELSQVKGERAKALIFTIDYLSGMTGAPKKWQVLTSHLSFLKMSDYTNTFPELANAILRDYAGKANWIKYPGVTTKADVSRAIQQDPTLLSTSFKEDTDNKYYFVNSSLPTKSSPAVTKEQKEVAFRAANALKNYSEEDFKPEEKDKKN